MKKSFAIVTLLVVFTMCSCKNKEDQSTIEAIVSDFYKTDYAYEETTERFASDGSLVIRTVYEGEVFQSPYKEHKKLISYDNFDSLSDTTILQIKETYFEEIHKTVTAYISTDNGWTKQIITRTYPYGYAESIIFSEVPDKNLSTDIENVFTGEYTVTPPSNNHSLQQISATIRQKYYIDKKSNYITRIETDLTDLNRMINIINYINFNEGTLEEAQKKVSDDEMKEINILTITDYGNPDNFQLPNIPD